MVDRTAARLGRVPAAAVGWSALHLCMLSTWICVFSRFRSLNVPSGSLLFVFRAYLSSEVQDWVGNLIPFVVWGSFK